MLKQPMQVYFDRQMIEFYKDLARRQGRSFAAVIREALEKNQKTLQKASKKHQNSRKDRETSEHKKFLQTIKKIRIRFANRKYYHPRLSNDELLYEK